MLLYIGADHNGFALKEHLKTFLKESGYTVTDVRDATLDQNDDYPDIAAEVGRRVSREIETARGIVICKSGVGVDVVTNKFPRIRTVLAMTPDQAFDARNDDDVNVLALGAGYLDLQIAKKILITWLETPFSNEPRFRRRIEKISRIEQYILHTPYSEAEEERKDDALGPHNSPSQGLRW